MHEKTFSVCLLVDVSSVPYEFVCLFLGAYCNIDFLQFLAATLIGDTWALRYVVIGVQLKALGEQSLTSDKDTPMYYVAMAVSLVLMVAVSVYLYFLTKRKMKQWQESGSQQVVNGNDNLSMVISP